MKLKNIFMILPLFTLTALQSEEAKKAMPTKIAFVDVNKIMNMESLEGTADEWKDKIEGLQKELQSKDAELAKMDEDLKKGVAALQKMEKTELGSDSAKEARTRELVKKQQDMEVKVRERENIRMTKLQELYNSINKKIVNAADRLRTAQGWDVIIGGGAISRDPKFDLTADVMADLNREYTKTKKPEPAKKK